MRVQVLIVDDEPDMLENCQRVLCRAGYECHTLDAPREFRQVLQAVRPDLLILDIRMPQVSGMTLLSAALADDPTLPIIMITGYATVASAVNAIREGAFDYLSKPFTADQLLVAVERAARHRRLALENRELRRTIAAFEDIVGSSPVMRRLRDEVQKVAGSEANVLITGESGTGKELIAQSIHQQSRRSDGPFIPVECAALPETLLESELFGHERGSFTGAVATKTGLLSEAHGGTVFLDEVTDLSLGLQSKVLRVLEQRQLRPVGGNVYKNVDLRLLAASNVDIDAAVATGKFREDLFYRLDVIRLRVPALREREGDVALLLQAFLQEFAAGTKRDPLRVSPDAWRALEEYHWPGNVRELRNLSQRLVVMDEDGWITLADLPDAIRGDLPVPQPTPGRPLASYAEASGDAQRAFRAAYVRHLLAQHGGNVSKAARAAGVSRRTVHRWLAEVADEGARWPGEA